MVTKVKLRKLVHTNPFRPKIITYLPKGDKKKGKRRAEKLGTPLASDLLNNCLTCMRWSVCPDADKSPDYRCTMYNQAIIDGDDLESLIADTDDDPEYRVGDETIFDPEDFEDMEEAEASMTSMIEAVFASNVPVPPDLRIKDSEIPQAKNFYQWATDPEFGWFGLPPFPRQLQVACILHGEYCPHCSDEEWLFDMPVRAPLDEIQERVQMLEMGMCPQCGTGKSTLINEGYLEDYVELALCVGQRGAKTSSTTLWESYNAHRMLKLPNPSSVYGQMSSTTLVCTFTALTFGQAVENIWNPFKNLLTNSEAGLPWFVKHYHPFLDRRGQELGEELYQIHEHSIRYRHRNLFYSPASPSRRTMRGKTRIGAAIDEVGFFKMPQVKANKEIEMLDAVGTHNALKRSLFTIKTAYKHLIREGFDNVPKPILYQVSSPSAINDFIMQSYRKSLGSKEVYGMKKATWEFSPIYTKEDFAEEFRDDPILAERDYGVNPPMGIGLFMPDPEIVLSAFRKTPNRMSVTTGVGKSRSGKMHTMGRVTTREKDHPFGSILSVDVGLVENSFAFSVMSLPENYDKFSEGDDIITPVKVLAAGEVIPLSGAEISMTNIYNECLVPLVEAFGVEYFCSDRWQNASIANALDDDYGVTNIPYQCKWTDFETVRELITTRRLFLPRVTMSSESLMTVTSEEYPAVFKGKPIDHLAWQFMSVSEQTGVTVVKPELGTDDLFRTIVVGCGILQEEDVVDYILTSVRGYAEEEAALGITKRRGGGGVSISSTRSGSDGEALGVMVKR